MSQAGPESPAVAGEGAAAVSSVEEPEKERPEGEVTPPEAAPPADDSSTPEN